MLKATKCKNCKSKIIKDGIIWCKAHDRPIDLKELLICYKYQNLDKKDSNI